MSCKPCFQKDYRLDCVRAAAETARAKIANCRALKHRPYKVIHTQDLCVQCLAMSYAAIQAILAIRKEDETEEAVRAFRRQEFARRLKEVGWITLAVALIVGVFALLIWRMGL